MITRVIGVKSQHQIDNSGYHVILAIFPHLSIVKYVFLQKRKN